MSAVFNEDTQYVDNAGIPYVGGKVYIGDVDADPVANPKDIFSDRELTVALANPQTLDATGRATTKIWTDGKYSLQVNDIDAVQVFQDLDRGEDTASISMTGLTNVAGGNTITAVATPVLTSYVDQSLYIFKAVQTNTGPTTLNIDGVGAKAVVQNNDIALGSGRIKADDNVTVQYNSTNDNFAIVSQKTNLVGYVTKSSNYTVLPEDLCFVIDCTAAFTLSTTAAATLGAGFSFFVKANGGLITLDPDGSSTIDGLSTLEILDGSSAEITCDGTNFHTVLSPGASSVRYRALAVDGTVVTSDRGALIDCTSTLALSLTAAATLTAGFSFYVKANGGSVAIDPDGSDTIDGDPTKVIADGSKALVICDGTNFHTGQIGTAAWPGQIFGLTTSNNATDAAKDIDIAIGQASSDDVFAADIVTMNLSTAITKQLDVSWSVGTASGGLDTGTIAADTWYHVFLIMRSDTGVVDALFSLSPTAPTMPTGYDKKRRIGSVLTDSTPDILAFTQYGDEFLWDTSVNDYSGGVSTVGASRTMTVPTGLNVMWKGAASIIDASPTLAIKLLISSLDQANIAATVVWNVATSGGALNETSAGASDIVVRTNTSAQIRSRANTPVDITEDLSTFGWIDHRGRLE